MSKKRRFAIALAVGSLVAAMLPGVASAAPPGHRKDGDPQFRRTVMCTISGGDFLTVISEGPAGAAQRYAVEGLQAAADLGWVCLPGTKTVTTERIPGDGLKTTVHVLLSD